MGQRSIPAPFLMKTYELVDDKVTNDVISWGENGTTFVVWKTADFAKDLLPKYFKHNNFSSFVRQLNTYGFRKIVPDKWEFANDNFKRGEQCLLSEIRRRKTTSSHAGKPDNNQSQSVSGNDVGSTSTSSPGMVVEVTDLSGENEKLRRDNEVLSLELSQAKKQCDELVNFLTSQLKVGPDHIYHILQQGSNTRAHNETSPAVIAVDNDDNDENKRDEGLKLFGVWLKEVDGIIKCGSKRGRCGNLQVDNNNDDKKNNSNNLGVNGLDCGRKFTKTC